MQDVVVGEVERPCSLSEEGLKDALRSHARLRRLTSERAFDSITDVTFMHATLCRVDLLLETHTQEASTGQGWRALTASADWPTIPDPVDWSPLRVRHLLDGSVQTDWCLRCQMTGRVRCTTCAGRGGTPCATDFPCGCGGRQTSGMPCGSCYATGRRTCTKCGGSGWTGCSTCNGAGECQCRQCGGAGQTTRYATLKLERIHRHVIKENTDAVPFSLQVADWALAARIPGAGIPASLEQDEAVIARAALTEASSMAGKRLLSELTVYFAPITQVAYAHKGAKKQAWIVGEHRRVVAPRAPRRAPRLWSRKS
jgi:hypothetical protein